ncbi:hypothetical protein RVR_P137 (plasmid) [Actinacidiphila reveromycinica]|uniref:TadE-like domain-containing protein n=1 Tax=Actinacidiphila reveromycinica TaxID=659352 RepID=A0A7R6T9N5_9ACTN|nr:TadE family protein [Streptomyces sp. SN-593]BBG20664.1 hypothetical protein RVR_P137 [Streptomyces sp. SN-593]
MRRVRGWTAAIRARAHGDQGDTSLQMAIVFPVVILMTVAVVQASMWYYARNIALTAAREGINVGRGYQSSPSQGAARARETLDRIGGDSLHGAGVSTDGSTADTVTITVSGTALSMLPFVPGLHVSQSASAAREHWTTP